MGGSTTTSRSLYSNYRDRHNDQGQTSPASLPSASGETPEFTYEPIQDVPDTPPLATFDFASFQPAPSSGLAAWRGMAAGGSVDEAVRLARGRILEDYYPSQYLPGVGRQVIADGGALRQYYDPAIVDLALMLLSRKA